MKISVRDFRCFHLVEDIEIRPINLLVGENSAGKSSLLAAFRFLFELFHREGKASFNKEPFLLGAYDQIAHFRGGRFGRAREFSFVVRDRIRKEDVSRRLRSAPMPDAPIPERFEIDVRFHNNRSQPSVSHVRFGADDFQFEASFGDDLSVRFSTPSGIVNVSTEAMSGGNVDPFSHGLYYLQFAINEARFGMPPEAKLSRVADREFRLLAELYRSAIRQFPSSVYASAPVRSKPERTYNPGEANPSPGGEHIPFVLAQIKSFEKERWSEIVETLERFGKASGLFEEINVRELGHAEGGPFQLIVTLNGSKSNIIDVGYGVSQILPIVTDLVRANQRTTFLFQQPEVHLHPKAQAELATFFCQIAKERRHTLFIETHSDHLIDRIRIEAREGGNIQPRDVSILFFERDGLDVAIHQITLDELGNLRGAPSSYRQFFIDEEFRSLGG